MTRKARPVIPADHLETSLRCPYLKHAVADWLWPVEGICHARRDGRLMVPPVPHYLHLCTTPDHKLCEVFRARILSRNPEHVVA